jgi:hypothetical protein
MKLPGGDVVHRAGGLQCEGCDAGWPRQRSEIVDHCCPGFIHAETRLTDGAAATTKVVYYCDVCDEDDPF